MVMFTTLTYANENQCSNILTHLKDDPDTLFVQLEQNLMTPEMAEDLFLQLSATFPGETSSAFVRYQFQTKDLLEVAKKMRILRKSISKMHLETLKSIIDFLERELNKNIASYFKGTRIRAKTAALVWSQESSTFSNVTIGNWHYDGSLSLRF